MVDLLNLMELQHQVEVVLVAGTVAVGPQVPTVLPVVETALAVVEVDVHPAHMVPLEQGVPVVADHRVHTEHPVVEMVEMEFMAVDVPVLGVTEEEGHLEHTVLLEQEEADNLEADNLQSLTELPVAVELEVMEVADQVQVVQEEAGPQAAMVLLVAAALVDDPLDRMMLLELAEMDSVEVAVEGLPVRMVPVVTPVAALEDLVDPSLEHLTSIFRLDKEVVLELVHLQEATELP